MAEPTGPQLTLDLAKDKKSMRLAMVRDGKIDAGVILNADQFGHIMAAMMDMRSQMLPEVPTKFPEGAPTHGMEGTHYHFGFDVASQQIKLSIRNSGLGWMTFGFDPDQFQTLLDRAKLAKP